MIKAAEGVSDFQVISDGGNRRVSVFGMGWTGYTLERASISDVFETSDGDDLDSDTLSLISSLVVFDDELAKVAHYFYNLGREHQKSISKNEAIKKMEAILRDSKTHIKRIREDGFFAEGEDENAEDLSYLRNSISTYIEDAKRI